MDKINEHECIQDKRITRLEDKADRLDTKIDKIMDILSDNKVTLGKILTRLNKKKEGDKERDEELKAEEKRMDTIEQEQSALKAQNKIVIAILTTLLIGFVLFFIEFNYKTFIFGI